MKGGVHWLAAWNRSKMKQGQSAEGEEGWWHDGAQGRSENTGSRGELPNKASDLWIGDVIYVGSDDAARIEKGKGIYIENKGKDKHKIEFDTGVEELKMGRKGDNPGEGYEKWSFLQTRFEGEE